MYAFVADKLGLNFAAAAGADGKVDETRVTIEKPAQLRVFEADFPIPHNALHDAASIQQRLKSLQK
jgi:hypothetical protein